MPDSNQFSRKLKCVGEPKAGFQDLACFGQVQSNLGKYEGSCVGTKVGFWSGVVQSGTAGRVLQFGEPTRAILLPVVCEDEHSAPLGCWGRRAPPLGEELPAIVEGNCLLHRL